MATEFYSRTDSIAMTMLRDAKRRARRWFWVAMAILALWGSTVAGFLLWILI